MCNFTNSEAFKVTLVDTAVNTNIAVRTKRIHSYVEEDESFMLMYGDGVADARQNWGCGRSWEGFFPAGGGRLMQTAALDRGLQNRNSPSATLPAAGS